MTRSPDGVRRVLQTADVFFCNEAEAIGLFGGVEKARTAGCTVLGLVMLGTSELLPRWLLRLIDAFTK